MTEAKSEEKLFRCPECDGREDGWCRIAIGTRRGRKVKREDTELRCSRLLYDGLCPRRRKSNGKKMVL